MWAGWGKSIAPLTLTLGAQSRSRCCARTSASDPDRLARLEREAKTLATLNHPNIAAIYGLERSAGHTALVMELVEGPTLADLIAQGAMPVDAALAVARQIAEALEAAHEQGIVHRDLKPANVKVKPDGVVKVLDFGLAKAAESAATSSNSVSQLPTITTPAMTQAGMILGTAAYMSPEQARGRPVDRRTDIWAFGCVLYEMLTGQRAFEGDDVAEVLARVIEREPDMRALPATTPASVRRLLLRCLVKDRRLRLPDIVDAILEIDDAPLSRLGEEPVAAPASRGGMWALLATSVFGIAAVAVAILYLREPVEERRPVKLAVLPPDGVALPANSIPAVSPDGRLIVFTAIQSGKVGLWLRDLESFEARLLPGTDGSALPFWSPDSRSIAFFADQKLKRIEVAGGSAVTLSDAGGQGRGGTWNADGVILFSADLLTPLYRVSVSGGSPVPITTVTPEEPAHRYPWFLPDGRHYLYTAYGANRDGHRLYVGELDSPARKALMPMTSNVIFTGGHLLFVRDQNLMAQPFDLAGLETTGDAVLVADRISYSNVDIRASFSASTNGVIAFASAGQRDRRQLTWMDRAGKQLGVIETPGLNPTTPAISPDGKLVVFRGRELSLGGIEELWVHDLARNVNSKLTLGGQTVYYPVWSPDQKWIAYFSTPGGDGSIYRRTPSGGAEEDLNLKSALPSDWSSDGHSLIYQTLQQPGEGTNLGVLPLLGDRKPRLYLKTSANERSAKLSANGKWLLYVSDETKRNEVYVQSFPVAGGGRQQISSNGGAYPVWSEDGREILLCRPERQDHGGFREQRRCFLGQSAPGVVRPQ